MVTVPVVCSIIQAASLYIFMTAKPKSDGRPNYKMFVMIGVIMSIALTCTLYTLAKQLLEHTDHHEEAGWLAINYVWPPAVALVTSTCHCYVYYNLFTTVSSRNIDHTLAYTMA